MGRGPRAVAAYGKLATAAAVGLGFRSMRPGIYGCVAGALLVLSAGCAGPTQQPAKPAMRALGQSAQVAESPSDETIGTEIRRRMQFADPAGTAGVIVEVSDAVVTLRGVVPDLPTAWRAEAQARAVPGTKRVINRLLVQ